MNERRAHWVKQNHQERMPHRMVAFDTESRSEYAGEVEVQEWRVGCAIRWRTDLAQSDRKEARVFATPLEFWQWVAAYTRKGERTVVWAHNLGHDVRISRMFEILPGLGFRLEWCNLDRNISSATWRSEHGTIVLADTWTWIPLPLNVIAPQVGLVKYDMPTNRDLDITWASYCMRDAEILYNVVRELVRFITDNHLGNWQPTGAGMAYATWRHKFLDHKILVHDDKGALEAERMAMHTGRAEAWKHGKLPPGKWTELDLRNAYLVIAAEEDLPRKLHMHTGKLSISQYRELTSRFHVLVRCNIQTDVECAPCRHEGRTIWPVGSFETWLWDCEVDIVLESGGTVRIQDSYTYVHDPILRRWAGWVLEMLRDPRSEVSPIARTHVKHCSRAFIGRLSLRTPSWERWGDNPDGSTGITHLTFPHEDRTTRLLHVGEDTFIETMKQEGKDSLPMVTSRVMSLCRVRIWKALQIAGTDHVAHVDTDSLLLDSTGLDRIRSAYGDSFPDYWAVKGTYKHLEVFGPRAYYRDKQRVVSGIPVKADEIAPGIYTGERWEALAGSLERDSGRTVQVVVGTWHLRRHDPRRRDAPGVVGETLPYVVDCGSPANGSRSGATASGE